MQYFEPNFVDEALVLLDRFAPHARVLAGGTLLGFEIRGGSSDATAIVNVKRIPELSQISADGEALTVGALVSARDLSADELVRRRAPLLALAAGSLGARQLRTIATLGGNLCSGHPAADLATALLASDAHCLVADIVAGPTRMALAEFLRIDRRSADHRTLLTAVVIPASAAAVSYQKMQTRRAFELALVAAAAAVDVDGGVVGGARIALGGAARTPIRAPLAEQWLAGKPADDESARDAGRIAARDDADPLTDADASAEYRRHLVAVLVGRALRGAWSSGNTATQVLR
jgi:aerobic carbon-monoxide dehydrogenase medium subunit